MKKTTSVKSKFAKKRANAKNPPVKDIKPKSEEKPTPDPVPPPPQDPQAAERIGGPTPEVRPCSPAETQKGHHEVVVT